ncbi:hypothetical protein BFF78_27385 [Streptomyces fodineus]|uniref:Uncharacterized protein n=1 Tax=Streptomyces fodineus TaxID=1904616 RepID=A0A1D7YFJ3_9ACTN|nr:hypothetical protein BFF78_27385 [Streptomyces fodineus]
MGAAEMVIFTIGCFVGSLTFKYAKDHHPGPVRAGDPAAAITAALSTMLALGLLLGVGDSGSQRQPTGEAPSSQVSIPTPTGTASSGTH